MMAVAPKKATATTKAAASASSEGRILNKDPAREMWGPHRRVDLTVEIITCLTNKCHNNSTVIWQSTRGRQLPLCPRCEHNSFLRWFKNKTTFNDDGTPVTNNVGTGNSTSMLEEVRAVNASLKDDGQQGVAEIDKDWFDVGGKVLPQGLARPCGRELRGLGRSVAAYNVLKLLEQEFFFHSGGVLYSTFTFLFTSGRSVSTRP